MKVHELIELLKECDQEAEVILSRDSEGNSFSPLAAWCDGRYVAETTWSGEFYSADDEEDLEEGEGVAAVLLWPTR